MERKIVFVPKFLEYGDTERPYQVLKPVDKGWEKYGNKSGEF